MPMSVNLIAEQTAANGGAKLPPLPASVSKQRDVFARVEAGSGEREERDDGAEGGEAGPAARPRGIADSEAGEREEQAVGEHVAVVEEQREVRGAAAFRPPFSHDLRGARAWLPANSKSRIVGPCETCEGSISSRITVNATVAIPSTIRACLRRSGTIVTRLIPAQLSPSR